MAELVLNLKKTVRKSYFWWSFETLYSIFSNKLYNDWLSLYLLGEKGDIIKNGSEIEQLQ